MKKNNNWKRDLNEQIKSHCQAYGVKELPYQHVPETTFDEIMEMQIASPELETLTRYMH